MLVVLGIGVQVDMYEINNIASWPYERNAIAVRSYDDLPSVETRLSNAICAGKYTIAIAPYMVMYGFCEKPIVELRSVTCHVGSHSDQYAIRHRSTCYTFILV